MTRVLPHRLLGPLLVSLLAALLTSGPLATEAPAAAPPRPNVVLVIMDDFSLELLSTMRAGQQLRREGAEFTNAYVVDSL